MFFCDQSDIFSKKALSLIGENAYTIETGKKENNEWGIDLKFSVRGRRVYLIKSLAINPNESIMELIFKITTLKSGDAEHISVVIPVMSYVENDTRKARSPLVTSVVVKLLESAGADRVIFLDMHSQSFRAIGDVKKDDIRPRKLFSKDMKERFGNQDLVFIPLTANDIGRTEGYEKYFPKAKIFSWITDLPMLCKLSGKKVIIISDVIYDFEKMKSLSSILRKLGAGEIHVYITHALKANSLPQLEVESNFSSITVGDTLQAENFLSWSNTRVVSIAQFFGQVLREIDSLKSVNNTED